MFEKLVEIICNYVEVEPEKITSDSRFMEDLGFTSYYNIFTVQGTAASRVFFRIVAKAVRMRESWPDVYLQGPARP
ncbi:acyl carrier protein [Flintibacter sp.]|uniref:acyl carrier protein n=1 Tax=Flintibacter sp. TaxID=1918624 RepID=UPI003A2758BA